MTKKEAIKHFGSAVSLAEKIGVTKQAISGWSKIPETRQYQIQVITDGALMADTSK